MSVHVCASCGSVRATSGRGNVRGGVAWCRLVAPNYVHADASFARVDAMIGRRRERAAGPARSAYGSRAISAANVWDANP